QSIIRTFDYDVFYGGKATLNVWNPKVDNQSDFSLAQLWVTTESFRDWLAAGWTADNYNTTGCYNLDCPGFVQTNRCTILGTFLRPVSVYGGQQYAVDIEIFKDKTTGNWWVRLQDADMGYWPKEIAPSLAEGATLIDFGGEVSVVYTSRAHPSTEMGSGHFPYEGFKKSSFFKNVQVLDSFYEYRNPRYIKAIKDKEGCYGLQVGKNRDGPWGLFFFFGGPGTPSEKCPCVPTVEAFSGMGRSRMGLHFYRGKMLAGSGQEPAITEER
ncbi:hypothetical protein Taro_018960, partial [Colocasia esculenta]|nr:hypothetical protein [Colocasia esculenta]